jgi:hypothetical protein
MTVSPGLSHARPGDVLLYETSGLTGWLLRTRLASNVTHTECYLGDGRSAASRDGIGVDTYPTRHDGLLVVLRPVVPFRIDLAAAWHETVIGQGYDWAGLFGTFTWAGMVASQGKQYCSAHTTRFQRAGHVEPFTLDTDAHKVTPPDFCKSPAYRAAWKHPKETR